MRLQVRCVSCDAAGQYLATGCDDGHLRLFDALTGCCLRSWHLGGRIHCVLWCPDAKLHLIAVVVENRAVLLPSGIGSAESVEATRRVLQPLRAASASASPDAADSNKAADHPAAADENENASDGEAGSGADGAAPPPQSVAHWRPRGDGGVDLVQRHQLRDIAWHGRCAWCCDADAVWACSGYRLCTRVAGFG